MTKKQKTPYRDRQENKGFHFDEPKQRTSWFERIVVTALVLWAGACIVVALIGAYEYFT